MQFTIQGELCDLNTYIDAERRNRFLASKIKKSETERVAWEAIAAKLGTFEAEDYPAVIFLTWYVKDSKKDSDNITFAKKFIADGLVEAGVLKDDSRKYVALIQDVEVAIDKENPRIEVQIMPV